MGFLAPWSLKAKIILQKTWIDKIPWDTPLQDELLSEATQFLSELEGLQEFSLPRSFLKDSGSQIKELFVFADASSKAYSAVAYLVIVEPDGTRRAELVFAKTRVRPLGKRLLHLNESLSICRLELLALLLGITVAAFVKSAFDQPLLT